MMRMGQVYSSKRTSRPSSRRGSLYWCDTTPLISPVSPTGGFESGEEGFLGTVERLSDPVVGPEGPSRWSGVNL